MPLSLARRTASLVLLAAASLAPGAAGQNPRADVKRFQWDPVVVHLAAESSLGVEVYMSVNTKNWGLTWINPDTLAAWLPQLRALLGSGAASDSTAWVTARGSDSRMRIVKGAVQGRSAFALQLRAQPATVRIEAWLPAAYVADLAKALDKSIDVARGLEHAPALAHALPVHEQWDVDTPPVGASAQGNFLLPEYMLRGTVVVGFVVDTLGRVIPSTVTVYDCDDPNLARQWAREVVAWSFVSGSQGDQRVATRIRMGFALDGGFTWRTGGDRVIPGAH
jgi:hypothetical protein